MKGNNSSSIEFQGDRSHHRAAGRAHRCRRRCRRGGLPSIAISSRLLRAATAMRSRHATTTALRSRSPSGVAIDRLAGRCRRHHARRLLRAGRGDRRLPRRAQFATWLTGIVVNACRDHRRRGAARAGAPVGAGRLAARPDGRDAYRQSWLASELARLDPLLRDTVVLIVGEDLTWKRLAPLGWPSPPSRGGCMRPGVN